MGATRRGDKVPGKDVRTLGWDDGPEPQKTDRRLGKQRCRCPAEAVPGTGNLERYCPAESESQDSPQQTEPRS